MVFLGFFCRFSCIKFTNLLSIDTLFIHKIFKQMLILTDCGKLFIKNSTRVEYRVLNRNCMCNITGILYLIWDRRGSDRMVVGFTITYLISAYHH
jgi:hypothetical protein